MLYRRKVAMVAVLVALGSCASMMIAEAVHGRHVGLFEFLTRSVHLCESDLQALKAGEAVAIEISSSPKNELFLFGAVRVDTPLTAYLAEHRNPLFFETEMVQAWGEFHESPSEEDLKDLTWPVEDLEALPECRPGSCKIKLPPDYLLELQTFIGDEALFVDKANALLRRTLIDYLNGYRRYGNAALMDYRDKQQAVSIEKEFDDILENFSTLNPYTLDLQTYLKDYPNSRPLSTQSRFLWAKVLLGGKAKRPIIFLYHLITYQMPGGKDTAVALKQIYASHYYDAALALTLMVADPENASRFYLLHFDRGRIDVLRDIPGFLSNGFRGDTRNILTRRLKAIKEETNRQTW
jgi:hypothetical protein